MRVVISQKTGKSAFDPSVVREAKRRVARQLRSSRHPIPEPPADPLPLIIAALPVIHGEGRIGNRKVFIATLWDRVGGAVNMSLPEFKRWLIEQHRRQRLILARADLIAAMPYELVSRSEAKTEGDYAGATFHFVKDPSIQ